MSNNTNFNKSNLNLRAESRAERRSAQVTQGAFGLRYKERSSLSGRFSPYVARAGELKQAIRITQACLKDGEYVIPYQVRQVEPDGSRTPIASDYRKRGVFLGPWLTSTGRGLGSYGPERPAKHSYPAKPGQVQAQQKMVGWLRAAAEFAEESQANGDKLGLLALRKFFQVGVDGTGTGPGSPCRLVEISDLVGRMSPGKLIRRMIEVRYGAIRRMRPVVGAVTRPSWAAVAVAAASGLPMGKATVKAMALTLKSPRLDRGTANMTYRECREWLVNHLATSKDRPETLEGVMTITRPGRVIHGVTASEAVQLYPCDAGGFGTAGRGSKWLGQINGFAYHTQPAWRSQSEALSVARRTLKAYHQHRDAIRAEWHSQEVAKMVEEGSLIVLVSRNDSYQAGNCQAGTEAFACELGIQARVYADAKVLLASHNERAIAAARFAIRRFAEAA